MEIIQILGLITGFVGVFVIPYFIRKKLKKDFNSWKANELKKFVKGGYVPKPSNWDEIKTNIES